MKMIAAMLLTAAALSAGCPASADLDETFASGKDWVGQMSPREKFMSLLPPALLFEEYDVRLRHTLPQYIQWMDHILLRNPRLEDEDVNNIFASTIFLFEPENRGALKTMESDFLRGDYDNRTAFAPRLSIEEILQEISPDV